MNYTDHELSKCSGNIENFVNICSPDYYRGAVADHGNIAISFIPNNPALVPLHDVHGMANAIPQVDGPPPPLPSPSQYVTPQHDPDQNIRRANYTLDRVKQVSRLCKDTKIDDFDITVSPIAHSVTIKCSTGFYTKVALPTFSGMSLHYNTVVNGIEIQCVKIDGQIDETGATVTDLMKFELKYEEARDKPTIGTVAVHFHHTTTRKLSCAWPSKSTSLVC